MQADRVRQRLHPDDAVTYVLSAPSGLSLQNALRSATLHGGTHVCLSAVAEADTLSLSLLENTLAGDASRAAIIFSDLPIAAHDSQRVSELAAYRRAGVHSVLLSFDTADARHDSALGHALESARSLDLTIRASISIKSGEPLEQRVDGLLALRALSADPVDALELKVDHPSGPDARREDEATAADYLKTLAVARFLLDDVPHLQASWSVQGPKVLELALRFGADDAGSVPWTQAGSAEPSHHGGESELRRIIRDAGYRPVERDPLFRASLLH